jgi:benzoyl-CoA reductase/2-hydroxyglutaryl-CoA dehydratase subunit BcrC/BadD/HgdB
MTDARVYSEAQVKTRVEAFMETLENRKAARA